MSGKFTASSPVAGSEQVTGASQSEAAGIFGRGENTGTDGSVRAAPGRRGVVEAPRLPWDGVVSLQFSQTFATTGRRVR